MCLLLCGIWLITAALGSGGILSAVLAVLQVWGGPRCMQTLLLLWPSLCICKLAARFAALQTVLCASPLLHLGLHHGSCDSAASAVLKAPNPLSTPYAATLHWEQGWCHQPWRQHVGPQPLCLLTCRHGRAASHAASICWRCTSGSRDDAVWCPPGSARALHGRPTRLWSAPRQVAAAAPLLGLASGPWMQSALTARLAAVTAQAAVPVSLLEACTWFPEVTYPWRWAELSCQSCGADQPLPIVKPHALCLLPLCACALHAAVCPAVGLTLCCVRAGYGPPPGYGMPGYGPPAGFPGYGPPAGFPGYGPPAGLMLSVNLGMTDV